MQLSCLHHYAFWARCGMPLATACHSPPARTPRGCPFSDALVSAACLVCAGEGSAAAPAGGEGEPRAHKGAGAAAAAGAPGAPDLRTWEDAQSCERSIAALCCWAARSWRLLWCMPGCLASCMPAWWCLAAIKHIGSQAVLQYRTSEAASLCPCPRHRCFCSTSSTMASSGRTCSPAREIWLCLRAGGHSAGHGNQLRREAASFASCKGKQLALVAHSRPACAPTKHILCVAI